MIYIDIYNFETEETKRFSFETVLEAEEFAMNYHSSEDEEITIGDDFFGMEWSDYLCWGQGKF